MCLQVGKFKVMSTQIQTPRWLKGHLLIDSGVLVGSFFERTVVLICEHNRDGAFGLVLNKPSQHRAGELAIMDLPEALESAPVYIGGPVQPNALSFLYSSAGVIDDATVLPNLKLGHSIEELLDLFRSGPPDAKVKLFAGYSGWGPNQLERELKQRCWLVYPASPDLVFDVPAEELWKQVLLRRGDWQSKLLAQMPPKPFWN